ncbi:MAG: VOC family protein [Bacteroidota bacterium]|nr:VOC family protein [Bacteroidota bacterium]GDX47454.1 methylmalonyl-CoA epimerase [Bacteroidota bacterium]
MSLLRLHHIGLIVESIDEAVKQYATFHPSYTCSNKYYVTSQGVAVLFFQATTELCFEFIEEVQIPSAISTFKKRGLGFYHIGYKTSEYDLCIKNLINEGYKVFDEIISEAYENKRVRFVLSPQSHWIEIIEE